MHQLKNIIIVTSSVPQGSKLAPLLHIPFANDIAKIFIFEKVNMYADDLTTNTVVNNNEDKNKFQNGLNELINWAKVIVLITLNWTNKWQLKINYDVNVM